MNLQKDKQKNTLEFSDSRLSKLIFFSVALVLFVISVSIIFYINVLISILGIGMCAYFLFLSINNFAYKLILGETFLEEKRLLKEKKVNLHEIIEIEFGNNNALISSSKENILIGGDVENSEELISHLVLTSKENIGFRLVGDLIAIDALKRRIPEFKVQTEQKTIGKIKSLSVLSAELIETGWLFRAIKLHTTNGEYILTYFGRGEGFECILVNEEVLAKEKSFWWYCPKFTFKIANLDFAVNVRVYPWLKIRKFWVEVEGKEIYREGF